MQILKTEVQKDHLELLLRVRPVVALVELIWNALDADASRVDVTFERDFTGDLGGIVVRDNGTGISELDATTGFRHLGGSWKRMNGRTRRDKRTVHGKFGQGRFRAFALGSDVIWRSWAKRAGVLHEITIASARDRLGEFRVSDVTEVPGDQEGTEVRVDGVVENANVLCEEAVKDELLEQLALYLRQYPHVAIRIDGTELDPQSLQAAEQTYVIPPLDIDGRLITDASITILEWYSPTSRSLYFCNRAGVARHSLPMPALRAPGFEFTAYLKSDYVQELYDTNDLFLEGVHPGVRALYDAALAQIRDHFRRRAAERASELVDQWKREGAYPYEGDATTPVEHTERQVFEVVALNVNEYLPSFSETDSKTRQFSLRLLRQAIESNPESMQRILTDVLGLPKVRQDELAGLLESTTLSSIIAAAKVVADRLNFLSALECMLFETTAKKQLRERSQLHRILADHTWIFGEQFNLSVDDQSLDAVLDKHIKLLGRPERAVPKRPVRGVDNQQQIVDLMLSKRIPQARDDHREHLIVELKRPSQKVDEAVFGQITKYAMAVAKDERFRDTGTNWVFWAISNDRDEFVDFQAKQPNRPRGVIGMDEELRITIWAKTWGDIIEESRGRLEFFRRQLDFTVNRETALDQLRKTHEKYFPAVFREGAKVAEPAAAPV